MPYTVQHDSKAGLLRITVTGVVSRKELDRVFDEIERVEDALAVAPGRITDLRGVERFEADFSQVFPVAERRKKRAHPNHFKSAILVLKPLHVGFVRMYQTLNDNPRVTHELFSDESEALAWLGVPSR